MPPFAGITFAGKPTQGVADTHNGARNKPNEDRFITFIGPGDNGLQAQFLVVADGVTSTHGGERASDIAVRVLRDLLQQPAGNGRPSRPLRDRMADAIHRANQEILETARKDPELKGMSTTLVIAAIDGDQLTLMHLGDSRAYLIREGKAHLLSRDHTWVQEALEEGRITPEQAANHPNKHVILRYLGDTRGLSIDQGILAPGKPMVDVDKTEVGGQLTRTTDTTLRLRADDALLLCSDGLYNRISDAEIAAAVTNQPPDRAVRWLIDEAVRRQEPDNITVVLWTSAEVKAAPAMTKSRRPALLLAGAGALLAIAAFLLLGRGGDQATQAQATTTPAATTPAAVAVAAAEATPTPVAASPVAETPPVTPTAADPTSTALATEPAAEEAVTESPTESPAESPTESPAEEPSEEPAVAGEMHTEAPAEEASPGSMPSATPTVTPTRMPTSTSVPTATPMPTATPSPSRTPTPTSLPTQAPAGQAAETSAPGVSRQGGPTAASIGSPPDNEASNSSVTFRWSANEPLAPGQEFEVIFWNANGESEQDGRGWARSTTATETTIKVGDRPPGAYRWALYLVQPAPYRKLARLTEPRTLTVSSGGASTGGGPGDAGGGTEK